MTNQPRFCWCGTVSGTGDVYGTIYLQKCKQEMVAMVVGEGTVQEEY